jgi:hypothetical protein
MLDVFEWDKAHAYGRHRNVAIQMWRGTVEARHVPIMEARWQSIASESSEFGILVVVLPSAPTPSSARREEIKRLYSAMASKIRAVGTVLEDQGIKGTAGSMAMTTIMLMSNVPYAYKNGTELNTVATWMCQQMPTLEQRSLIGAVEHLRRRYADVLMRELNEPIIMGEKR